MFCTSCGKEFQNDMNFCPYCGTPVAKNEQQPQDYNYGYNYNQAQYNNGQYYAGQQPFGYNAPNPNDVPSAGFNALAFFFPIVGLILYLVWKDETPKRAKAIGKWALISVIIGVVVYILAIIAMIAVFTFAGVSTFTYMM